LAGYASRCLQYKITPNSPKAKTCHSKRFDPKELDKKYYQPKHPAAASMESHGKTQVGFEK